MAVNKKLKKIYNNIWEKPELFVANTISDVQEKKKLKKYRDPSFTLTESEKRQIKNYWKPYINISTEWCAYYYSQNGIFDPRYIPNDLYFSKIDQYFNNRKLGWGFNDKNYYSLIFSNVKQPTTLVRKIGTLLFDASYKLISIDAAMEIIKNEQEIIIKPTQESGSGRGISFFKIDKQSDEVMDALVSSRETNFIVQRIVKQHPFLSNIYANSLNSIRITTLLMEDGVHILSSVLRMGAGNSRVDNASNGGVSVGIQSNGELNEIGHILYAGNAIKKHPQGFVFKGNRIPYYEKIVETVKSLAQITGNFRLVSWDMSIDDDNNVILIEANMRKGGIAIHQFNNGPLFGDLTDRVLNEIFYK